MGAGSGLGTKAGHLRIPSAPAGQGSALQPEPQLEGLGGMRSLSAAGAPGRGGEAHSVRNPAPQTPGPRRTANSRSSLMSLLGTSQVRLKSKAEVSPCFPPPEGVPTLIEPVERLDPGLGHMCLVFVWEKKWVKDSQGPPSPVSRSPPTFWSAQSPPQRSPAPAVPLPHQPLSPGLPAI